jgi:signal transduction histidine kinase
VVEAQRLAVGEAVRVDLVAEEAVTVMADGGLVAGAVENLLRNAAEAMPAGGAVRVDLVVRPPLAIVVVEDDGPGMDATTREAALDDFFTTKATGSGLGLSFVRRVAEAHGTRVRLTSAPGKGTRVELPLPLADDPPASSEEG